MGARLRLVVASTTVVLAATAAVSSVSDELGAFQRITKVCATCAPPLPGGGLRATRASVANTSAETAEACGAACLGRGDCVSFNFHGTTCELNQYAEGYTVVNTSTPWQYWLRRALPGEVEAQARAQHAVPYQLAVPIGNVSVHGGVLEHSMHVSIDYLLRNYGVDEMLWWFRFRAGDPSPPGHPQGWDRCSNNLRVGDHMCLKGTVASTFLMGAGGILRWPAPEGCCTSPASSCCASRAELRRRFDEVLAGIYKATEASGFAAAFAENETMYRENPDYVLSWLTHGLLEAEIAHADSSGKALGIARGMIDWFSNTTQNFLLPEFMPPDRTIAADVPPMYGANTGHQIYLISQGIIHHSRMATSRVGKQRDVDVIRSLYEEDEWLAALAAKDEKAIWQKKWFPHNYEVTAFEAYLDMFTMTGDDKYLRAIQGAWEMFRESFLHVGGAMALNEGSSGTNLSAGLWYPPKSYYLEGDSTTGFQAQGNPHISGETCGSVFWIKLNQRFHQHFPDDERYVAEIERSLVNIGVANQAAQIGSPLAGVRSFALLHGHKNKIQNISTCCEGQGTRLHGSLPEYLFSPYTAAHTSGGQGVSIDIFAAASHDFLLAGAAARLTIDSAFPYPQPEGQPITITLHDRSGGGLEAAEFEIALRIPGWLATPTAHVTVTNEEARHPARGSYLKIRRVWQHGDTIGLTLPMGFRVTDYVGKNQIAGRKRAAFEYGPTLLLAVPSANAAWDNATNCLHLRGVNASAPEEWLASAESGALHFKAPTTAVAGGGSVVFRPYFEVQDELMTAYPAYDL